MIWLYALIGCLTAVAFAFYMGKVNPHIGSNEIAAASFGAALIWPLTWVALSLMWVAEQGKKRFRGR